jgi:hypothetical protein
MGLDCNGLPEIVCNVPVLRVLNEFDVCIKDPVAEPVPEIAVINPLVAEIAMVVCPVFVIKDPVLPVIEGLEPPLLMVLEKVELSNEPVTELVLVDDVLATFTALTEVTELTATVPLIRVVEEYEANDEDTIKEFVAVDAKLAAVTLLPDIELATEISAEFVIKDPLMDALVEFEDIIDDPGNVFVSVLRELLSKVTVFVPVEAILDIELD